MVGISTWDGQEGKRSKLDPSVMSNDMKELSEGKETITSTIRGHKAKYDEGGVIEDSEFYP